MNTHKSRIRMRLWWLLPFVVMALNAGCSSDEEAATATTAQQPAATTAPI